MESRVERLRAELRAIAYFDSEFLSGPRTDFIESFAYLRRGLRKNELLEAIEQEESHEAAGDFF